MEGEQIRILFSRKSIFPLETRALISFYVKKKVTQLFGNVAVIDSQVISGPELHTCVLPPRWSTCGLTSGACLREKTRNSRARARWKTTVTSGSRSSIVVREPFVGADSSSPSLASSLNDLFADEVSSGALKRSPLQRNDFSCRRVEPAVSDETKPRLRSMAIPVVTILCALYTNPR